MPVLKTGSPFSMLWSAFALYFDHNALHSNISRKLHSYNWSMTYFEDVFMLVNTHKDVNDSVIIRVMLVLPYGFDKPPHTGVID